MVGTGENQGDKPRLGWVQVSVSPQGFGSGKSFCGRVDISTAPALHRRSFYSPLGLVLGTTQARWRQGARSVVGVAPAASRTGLGKAVVAGARIDARSGGRESGHSACRKRDQLFPHFAAQVPRGRRIAGRASARSSMVRGLASVTCRLHDDAVPQLRIPARSVSAARGSARRRRRSPHAGDAPINDAPSRVQFWNGFSHEARRAGTTMRRRVPQADHHIGRRDRARRDPIRSRR